MLTRPNLAGTSKLVRARDFYTTVSSLELKLRRKCIFMSTGFMFEMLWLKW